LGTPIIILEFASQGNASKCHQGAERAVTFQKVS
jgi:hypothetical protein